MMSENDDARPILGAVVNQINGIRDALGWTLGGQAIPHADEKIIETWIVEQGLTVATASAPNESSVTFIFRAIDAYRREQLQGLDLALARVSSSEVSPEGKKLGLARSGAGWSKGADFCISSALVRLLGAWEQFELDVLKVLLFYRANPLGPSQEYESKPDEPNEVLEIISEEPKEQHNVQYYALPVIWTWLKPYAQDREQRGKLFKRVYGLERIAGATSKERSQNNTMREDWYDKRNVIAHGRGTINVTLGDYLAVEALVLKSVVQVVQECESKLRVTI